MKHKQMSLKQANIQAYKDNQYQSFILKIQALAYILKIQTNKSFSFKVFKLMLKFKDSSSRTRYGSALLKALKT